MKIEDIKILDLMEINLLKKKVTILHNYTNIDFYKIDTTKTSILFLLENSKKINDDFHKNIKDLRFPILIDDELTDIYGYLFFKDLNLDEFSNLINTIPFKFLKKRKQNEIIKKYNEFINLKDNYEKSQFIKKEKRR